MLLIRVELHSAITGEVSEIARMRLYNTGEGTRERGDYVGEVYRGGSFETLDLETIHKSAEVKNWPRLRRHVWNLVAVMLNNLGYGEK
jgi:hypothetical protein